MASYNHVTLLGNLCRDPELRYTPKGIAVASISLALNRKWKDAQTGETREEVSFLDCTAFGRTAEVAGQYCHKGDPLMVDGRLKQESWEDKQTSQKRHKIVVVVEQLILMGQKGEPRSQDRSSQPDARGTGAQPDVSTPAQETPSDDDVPF